MGAGVFRWGLGLMALLIACVAAGAPAPGSPDAGFRPLLEDLREDGEGVPGDVRALALQEDGRILVGGLFRRVNGVARTNLARLMADGLLDETFRSGVDSGGAVEAIVVRADGRIWVGGGFTRVNGERRVGLARLTAEGALDGRFELIPEMAGGVLALATQPDGGLLVGGKFTLFDFSLRRLLSLVRLKADGTLDGAFEGRLVEPEISDRFGEPEVKGVFPQRSGRIVLRVRSPLAMPGDASLWAIDSQGRRDWAAFGYYHISRVALNAFPDRDDRLLVIDRGPTPAGGGGGAIRRVSAGGDFDPGFREWNPVTATAALALPDGRAVLAGFGWDFGLGSVDEGNVVRLRGDGSLDPAFGRGTRIRGWVRVIGQQADGRFLFGGVIEGVGGIPLAGLCRLHGGEAEGPVIVVQPQGRTQVAGTDALLEVAAAGTPPLSYQWRNLGRDLAGATHSILRIPGVGSGEAHVYSVQVSNLVGMTTSVVARLNVIAATRVVFGPESMLFRPGDGVRLRVEATGPAPLTYAWYRDGVALPGAHVNEFSLPSAGPADAGEYWVEVSGPGGTAVSSRAFLRTRVIQSGDVDPGFAPGSGADGRVAAVVVRTDGKVVLGGAFSNVAELPRRGVALLLTNGVPDAGFVPQLPADLTVTAVAASWSGHSLVGGAVGKEFQARGYVARLDSAGTAVGEAFSGAGLGAAVTSLAVQSDDRVVVGGHFEWQAGPAHVYTHLVRLRTGLEPDHSFPTNLGLSGSVGCLAVDGENRIVLGGTFTSVQGQRRTGVARLLASGDLDLGFDAGEIGYLTGPGSVHRLALAPDGSCYVLGTFDRVGGHPALGIVRLNGNGTVDAGFAFSLGSTPHEEVRAVCVQSNGWPVIAGRFDPYHVGGITTHVLRLTPDGLVDATFGPQLGLSPQVACLVVQPDQTLLVGGDLAVSNPDHQREIVRLLVGESAAPFFVREPEDVLTVPGAAGLLWAQAEGSRRVGYQWEKDGQALPGATNPPLVLPVLGDADAGLYTLVATNGLGIARSRAARVRILPAPMIDAMSSNRTVVAGDRAVVEVLARGGEPLRYEWFRDGVRLRGIEGPRVVLDPVARQDDGAYRVNVLNDLRSVQSPVSRLTVVVPPRLVSSPTGRSVPLGEAASLQVESVGTEPLSFRWWRDDQPIAGGTNAGLAWTAVSLGDAGVYRAVVTNAWGAATSAPVRIEVLIRPFVTRAPHDQTVPLGGSAAFEVEVAGRPYPLLQWLFENREIPGAHGPTLLLTNVQAAQAGSYSVVAGSIAGTTRSSLARLAVGEVAPSLSEVLLSLLPDGTFVVEARALPGEYRVDVSEDLRVWANVWTGRVTDGRLRFVESGALARDRRFFRIGRAP